MKKRIALLLAAAMTISMLAGCGSKEEPAADAPASTEEDAEAPAEGGDAEAEAEAPAGDGVAANTTGKVAFVTWQSDAWHHQTALITQQALEEAGYTCDLLDTKGDDAEVLACLENCLSAGDYTLVIYAGNVAQPDVCQRLMAAGTSCVQYSTELEDNKDFISTWICSEYDLGYLVSQRAAKELPENANVVLLRGVEGYSGSIGRGNGFHAALEEEGRDDVTILEEKYLKFQKMDAMTTMEDWITKYGDEIDGVISENDDMALGAIEALQGANIPVGKDGVLVYGIDGLYAGCMGVKEGKIQASALQSSDAYAEAAVERVNKLVNGEMKATDYEDLVFDAAYIDETNVDEFIAKYEELGLAQ